jgi:hypothetical protein
LFYDFPTIFSLSSEPQFGLQVKFDLLWNGFVAHCICPHAVGLEPSPIKYRASWSFSRYTQYCMQEWRKHSIQYISSSLPLFHRDRHSLGINYTISMHSAVVCVCLCLVMCFVLLSPYWALAAVIYIGGIYIAWCGQEPNPTVLVRSPPASPCSLLHVGI